MSLLNLICQDVAIWPIETKYFTADLTIKSAQLNTLSVRDFLFFYNSVPVFIIFHFQLPLLRGAGAIVLLFDLNKVLFSSLYQMQSVVYFIFILLDFSNPSSSQCVIIFLSVCYFTWVFIVLLDIFYRRHIFQ